MNLLDQLANNNGLLGLLLALSIVAIVFLYKRNYDLQDKRIEDAKENRDAIIEPLKGIQRSLDYLTKEGKNV
jgi:hypothetical protein